MNKALSTTLSLVVLLWMFSLTPWAAAQGHAGGHGKGKATQTRKATHQEAKAAEKGKPEEKGLEHAEQVASPTGVEHGIEKAEAKQAAHGPSEAAKEHKGKQTARGKKH